MNQPLDRLCVQGCEVGRLIFSHSHIYHDPSAHTKQNRINCRGYVTKLTSATIGPCAPDICTPHFPAPRPTSLHPSSSHPPHSTPELRPWPRPAFPHAINSVGKQPMAAHATSGLAQAESANAQKNTVQSCCGLLCDTSRTSEPAQSPKRPSALGAGSPSRIPRFGDASHQPLDPSTPRTPSELAFEEELRAGKILRYFAKEAWISIGSIHTHTHNLTPSTCLRHQPSPVSLPFLLPGSRSGPPHELVC